MKRAYFLLAISLIAILFSNSLFAQTSTIMSVSTTEREIPSTTTFEPIKSINISNDRILSLAQDFGIPVERKPYVIHHRDSIYPMDNIADASFFILSMEGNSNLIAAYIQNVTITDFEYDRREDMVYFCGIQNIGNNANPIYQNIIGWITLNQLFSGVANIDLYPINIPNISSTAFLKKIDFYRVLNSDDKKLSLIINDNGNTFAVQGDANVQFPISYFITYDLQTNNYHIQKLDKVRLTDVIHTDTKVGVVGLGDKKHLVLFVHEQYDVDIYWGKVYETYTLYEYSTDVKYSIEALDNDVIIVGVSLIADGYGRMEFTTFDISSGINLMYTQAMANNNDIECRSKINDMKYDKEAKKLNIVAFDGCHLRNIIFQLEPYNTSQHTSHIVIPDKMTSIRNLLKSITIYAGINEPCYLTIGALDNQTYTNNSNTIAIGNLYFFDRLLYNFENESQCEQTKKIEIEVVSSKYEPEEILYEDHDDQFTSGVTYPVQNTNFSSVIICNDRK